MDEPSDPSAPAWSASPTAKAKNAVQRSVTALLDELAPERVLRALATTQTIEQHRTPNGCVLQAPECALSVSWFPEPSDEASLGELHVLVWQGTVARRGGKGARKGGATIVSEMIVRPADPTVDSCMWQALDGTRYDLASLTAKCTSLLEAQILAST